MKPVLNRRKFLQAGTAAAGLMLLPTASWSHSYDLISEIPPDEWGSTNIKIMGVGGSGARFVEHMIDHGIQGAEFICAHNVWIELERSRAHKTVTLGRNGIGLREPPMKGRLAAELVADDIRSTIDGARILFIATGMGTNIDSGPRR